MSKRPYKPTELKVLEGNRGKRKIPTDEPKPKPVLLDDVLAHFDEETEAKTVAERLAPILTNLGLLTSADIDTFWILCLIRARLSAINKFIREENKSLVQAAEKPSPDGGVFLEYKPSPYSIMEKQYFELFRKFAKEFGLTPVGRIGLSVKKPKDKDEMGDLLD